MTYGFILRFRIQEELNSACELLRKKSSSFALRKFINPANISRRFTLVIECTEQDMVDVMEKYLPRFYSGDVEKISGYLSIDSTSDVPTLVQFSSATLPKSTKSVI